MEQKITVTNNQNILDIAVKELGGLSGLFAAAQANGISITDDLDGMVLLLDVPENKTVEVVRADETQVEEQLFIHPIYQQNLLDIALQESGSISAVFDYMLLNGISLTEPLPESLKIAAVAEKDILDFYKFHNVRPATGGEVNKDSIPEYKEGIDYWAIGIDFIVS